METNDAPRVSSQRLVTMVIGVVWVVFACGLPLRTASEARRQAHLQLTQVFADGKADAANIVATFDRATQDVIAAATLPCLALAVCIIFLIHQMLKLKRRYHALESDLRAREVQAPRLTDHPLD